MDSQQPHCFISHDTPITITVSDDESILRIDHYIAKQFPLYSRSFFKKLINQQCILLNGTPVKKSSITIKPKDCISICVPPPPSLKHDNINTNTLDIKLIYQHEHFLIIYKPAGLTTHKPHTHSTEITLVDWLLLHHQEIAPVGSVDRPGIVHRIDKNTSGIMVIARTNYGHTVFNALFKERKLKKTYYAIVKGHPNKTGTIEYAIGRHPTIKTKMIALSPNDTRLRTINKIRDATTHYTVEQYFNDYSLVRVTIVTGRTHQIRVHFAHIGHPLIGDNTYGESSPLINRQALHAQQLSFTFEEQPFTFSYPIPNDMRSLLNDIINKK